MTAEIKKSVLGKLVVVYDCPGCSEKLRSAIDEIGKEDSCSTCQSLFVIPGEPELQRLRDQQCAEAERKASAKAERVAAAERNARMVAEKSAAAERKSALDLEKANAAKELQKGNVLRQSEESVNSDTAKQLQSKVNSGCTIGCLGLIAFSVLLSFLTSNPNGSQPTGSHSGVGETARLRMPSGGDVPVAISQEAHDRLVQLSVAKDNIGLAQLMAAGMAWTVPGGTQCHVIDVGIFTYEVRIIEGRHAGTACFVSSDFVSR